MPRSLLTLLFLSLVIAGAFLIYFGFLRTTTVPDSPPITAATFSDGSKVIIHRVAYGLEMPVQIPGRRIFLSDKVKSSNSSTSSYGEFETDRSFTNGHPDNVTFKTRYPTLILYAEALKSSGESQWDDLITERWSRHPKIAGLSEEGEALSKEDAPKGSHPLLSIEAEDGAGGWRKLLIGPRAIPDQGKRFFSIPEFPRDKTELRLRATLKGQQPVELTVPNPAHNPAPHQWQPEDLPATQDLGIVSIEAHELEWRDRFWQPMPELDLEIVPKIDTHPKDAFRIRFGEWETPAGNVSDIFFPLPNTQVARYSGAIARTGHFSFDRSKCTIIGTATWKGADSLPLEFDVSPEAIEASITKISITGVKEGSGFIRKDWQNLIIQISGEGNTDEILPHLIGKEYAFFCAFIGDQSLSCGSTNFGGSSRSYSDKLIRETSSFSHTAEWPVESSNAIPIGTQISIAIPPQTHRWPFSFTVDLDQ